MIVKSNFTSTAYGIGISGIFLIMSTRYLSESDFIVMMCIVFTGIMFTFISDVTTKISIEGDELHVRKWLLEGYKIKINDINQVINSESDYWNYSFVHIDYVLNDKKKRLSFNSGNYRISSLKKLLAELDKLIK